MSPDEQMRAAYNDLIQVAATVDRHGSWLNGDPQLVAHTRTIRGHLAALIDLLCIRIGACRPDHHREQWWQRMS